MPGLPQIPQHFVDRAMNIAQDPPLQEQDMIIDQLGSYQLDYRHRTVIKDKMTFSSRCQQAFPLGEDFEFWVKQNIHSHAQEANLRISFGDSTVHGPHVDNPAKIRFFYLLDNGGNQAETIFYHRPGSPFVYDADNWNSLNPIHHNNIDELNVIDRVCIPLKTWILFNGYVLHGVNNVERQRVNINVSFKPDTFDFAVKVRN